MRKSYILGNWKMHKTIKEAQEYCSTFCPLISEITSSSLVGIAAPFTALSSCAESLKGSPILLGAQNVHQELSGAFTGEISLPMLEECHVHFVLIGHSERRHIFHESEEVIASKVARVAQAGILPVLCIGETLEEREKGITKEVLRQQLIKGLSSISKEASFIIAYEPVWAIGTGKIASIEDVEAIHAFCREELANIFSQSVADRVSILYGGSVKADNAASFASCANVDGLLVGGASLDPESFSLVVKNFHR